MKGSLDLGKIAGIKIRVHWTFLLLILWIVFLEVSRGNNLEAILWSILFMIVLFGCVVLHELGHALTARRYNIGTRQITLLPIGGVASLEDMPENPVEEFFVAIAGPAVNAVIALLLYSFVPLENFLSQDAEAMEQTLSSINASNFLLLLFSANLMLVLFNLLPAFPMDGGRVLRALLSMKMDRVAATEAAARLGQVVAFFFFLIGLLYNPILILIAIFVYIGAQGENMMVRQRGLLKNYKVRSAMMTDITQLKPDDSLDQVVDVILNGTERDFVVVENGGISGILYHADIIEALRNQDVEIKVKEVMDTDYLSIHADDELTEVYRQVSTHNKSFFPVLEGEKPVGAIDLDNINEFMVLRAQRG